MPWRGSDKPPAEPVVMTAADAVIKGRTETFTEDVDPYGQNVVPVTQGDEDTQSQGEGKKNAGGLPGGKVESKCSAQRILEKWNGEHGRSCMQETEGVKRLTDERQQNNARQVFSGIVGENDAGGQTVGEKGERQAADDAHLCHIAEQDFSAVINEHGQTGKQVNQTVTVICPYGPGHQDRGKKVGNPFFIRFRHAWISLTNWLLRHSPLSLNNQMRQIRRPNVRWTGSPCRRFQWMW